MIREPGLNRVKVKLSIAAPKMEQLVSKTLILTES